MKAPTPNYPAQTGTEADRTCCALLLFARIPKNDQQRLVLREIWRLFPPKDKRAFRRRYPGFFVGSKAGAR